MIEIPLKGVDIPYTGRANDLPSLKKLCIY
jgi:hypothetical protein